MFTRTDIEKYFIAEKQESLLFLVIGIIAIILAVAFHFFTRPAAYKGAAIPLFLIGIIQIVVGFTVYDRSDADRIRNVYAYDMNPDQLRQEELPRMEKVAGNFVLYRWMEIAFAAAGIILIIKMGGKKGNSFWYGFGIALMIQAFLMLGADYFAERRAKKYTLGIKAFLNEKT
jgi:hypothetical protein